VATEFSKAADRLNSTNAVTISVEAAEHDPDRRMTKKDNNLLEINDETDKAQDEHYVKQSYTHENILG